MTEQLRRILCAGYKAMFYANEMTLSEATMAHTDALRLARSFLRFSRRHKLSDAEILAAAGARQALGSKRGKVILHRAATVFLSTHCRTSKVDFHQVLERTTRAPGIARPIKKS